MAQELLYYPDIGTGVQYVGGETVPQPVRRQVSRDARGAATPVEQVRDAAGTQRGAARVEKEVSRFGYVPIAQQRRAQRQVTA